ncbi:UNVERIFIED_CONTAM: hypothetical protein RKD43_006049 [Streptomyces graminofaciens]
MGLACRRGGGRRPDDGRAAVRRAALGGGTGDVPAVRAASHGPAVRHVPAPLPTGGPHVPAAARCPAHTARPGGLRPARRTRHVPRPRSCPAASAPPPSSRAGAVPAGAFDLDHVTGDVEIRHADGPETFTPLGEPDAVEHPKPGEIIYTDTTAVLTRHWNHRDAHRTRVTENSTHVAFVLETVAAERDDHLLKTAAGELRDLLAPHAAGSTVHYLSPEHTQVRI